MNTNTLNLPGLKFKSITVYLQPMKNTDQQYDNVISACRETFELKTRDYGTAWRILRPSSLTDQIFIKASRIRSIQENEGLKKVDEGIEGEFRAIINYSVMSLIQLQVPVEDDNYAMNADRALKLYDKYVAETKALMQDKNHDYGEAWRDMRVSSMTDLILMKLLRIKQIESNDGKTIVSEGLASNFQDILNYAAFALIKLTEEKS